MSAPFRFVLILPDTPDAEAAAFRTVCGVPIAERLLEGARRAGAVELWLRGAPSAVDRVRARLGRDDLRTGEPPKGRLPTVEAPAAVELSSGAFALLARADGSVFVPGLREVAKDPAVGPPRPLWEGHAASGVHALRVTSAEEVRAAKRQIFRELEPRSASKVASLLNAPISQAMSWFLVETRVTPALATAAHALVGILSAFFFAASDLGSLLVAGALFELASVLDGVDGELARAKLRDTPRGAWIDTAGDTVAYLAFVAGLSMGYAEHAAAARSPWAPVVPGLGFLLVSSSIALVASMGAYAARAGTGGSMSGVADALAHAIGARSRVLRALVELGRRAVFSKVVALLAALGAITRQGAFFDALFFGTCALVFSMNAALFGLLAARRPEARAAGRLTSRRARA